MRSKVGGWTWASACYDKLAPNSATLLRVPLQAPQRMNMLGPSRLGWGWGPPSNPHLHLSSENPGVLTLGRQQAGTHHLWDCVSPDLWRNCTTQSSPTLGPDSPAAF